MGERQKKINRPVSRGRSKSATVAYGQSENHDLFQGIRKKTRHIGQNSIAKHKSALPVRDLKCIREIREGKGTITESKFQSRIHEGPVLRRSNRVRASNIQKSSDNLVEDKTTEAHAKPVASARSPNSVLIRRFVSECTSDNPEWKGTATEPEFQSLVHVSPVPRRPHRVRASRLQKESDLPSQEHEAESRAYRRSGGTFANQEFIRRAIPDINEFWCSTQQPEMAIGYIQQQIANYEMLLRQIQVAIENRNNEIGPMSDGNRPHSHSSPQDVIAALRRATVTGDHERRYCVICSEPISVGSTFKTLPCRHIFHLHCIDNWLKFNTWCPLDRKRICRPNCCVRHYAMYNPRSSNKRVRFQDMCQGRSPNT